MERYELIDLIEEIQIKNDKMYIGTNESDLATREDIADLIIKLLKEQTKMTNKEQFTKTFEFEECQVLIFIEYFGNENKETPHNLKIMCRINDIALFDSVSFGTKEKVKEEFDNFNEELAIQFKDLLKDIEIN